MQDQGEPPPGWLHPTLQHTARLPLPTVQRRPSPCARCSIPLLCFFTLRGRRRRSSGEARLPERPGPVAGEQPLLVGGELLDLSEALSSGGRAPPRHASLA